MNDEIVATVKAISVDDLTKSNTISLGQLGQVDNRGYTKIGTIDRQITWKDGVAFTVVARIIAGCLTYLTEAEIIRKIGKEAIINFTEKCVGGRVKSTLYQMKAGSTVSYKHVWSITTNDGVKHGNYTSYASG